MSDTILSGDFTVYYLAENRQKQVVWSGSATGTRTVNELYSALADLLDELGQMDDGTAISAQTPTEYTIGVIDPSDKDPWFIDRTTVEHLTGGAIKTASWLRATGTNTGIVRVPYSLGTDFIASDIGKTVTHTDGDNGTLLDYKTVGSTGIAWIRPTNNTTTHDWNSTSGTISVTGGTGSVTQTAASNSGESLWANIYSLGTIQANTHLYVYQAGSNLKKYKSTTADWWLDGHVDILVNVKEVSSESDEGYITVFARQYGKTYGYYIVDLTSGGRNPIPLATGGDLNNDTGFRQFTGSSGVGTFNSGNYIYVGATWSTATKKGALTAVGGTGASPVLSYYLLGNLTDFAASDAVKEYTGTADGDGTCTAGAPSAIGPSTYSVTITHASNETFDVNEDGTTENYSIVVNLGTTYTVKQGYEFTKYACRRGGTTTTTTDGIEGERYIGSDYRITYTGITGSISEGAVVTQYSGGFGVGFVATGTVVAHNTTDSILILRNSRGTFNSTNPVYVDGANYVTGPTSVAITPITEAPFGTFAGGKWFCAPGVVLQNILSTDANNYQLTDDNGTVRVAPTKVTAAITNTRLGDRVAVFRLTASGGIINKTEFTATVQQIGDTSAVVSTSIPQDVPGKSVGGIIRLVDDSADVEYRLRYSSWAGSTFTLASSTGLIADAGTDTNTIVDTSAFVTAKVGDIIHNVTRSAISYIVSITTVSEVEISPAITSQTTGDSYQMNTIPVLSTTSDNYYVPLIDVYETAGTGGSPGLESVSITYSADVPALIRTRNAGDILPFETESTVTSSGMSVAVIRTTDTIYT